jgi:hypothetical protein
VLGAFEAFDSAARTPFPENMQPVRRGLLAAALASRTTGARVAKMAFAATAIVLVALASRPVLTVPLFVLSALAMAVQEAMF